MTLWFSGPMPTSNNYRIQVVGTSGSGKTTLACDLAERLNIEHLELDSLHHQAGWTPLPKNEFKATVGVFAAQSNWVIDGLLSGSRRIVPANHAPDLVGLSKIVCNVPLVVKNIVARH